MAFAAKIKQIQDMGFDVDVQLLETVLQANEGDVDKALDEILTMNATEALRSSMPGVLRGSIKPSAKLDVPPAIPSAVLPSMKAAPAQVGQDIRNEEIMQLKALALENLAQQKDAKPLAVAAGGEEFASSQVVRIAEDESDLETLLNMNVLLGLDNTWPQFTIYRRSDMITTAQINEISSIQKLLVSVGATERREVDLSYDYELQGLLKNKCASKKVDFALPLVFFRDSPIGNLAKLTHLRDSGELKKMVESDSKQHAELTAKATAPMASDIDLVIAAAAAAAGLQENPLPQHSASKPATTNAAPVSSTQLDLQLNFFDKCLNTVESFASWFNPWSWLSKPDGRNSKTHGEYREFDVVQSNWYWRHQLRKLRFASDFFVRLHPALLEIRAMHKIEDVAKITILNSTNFIIHYKDRSSPDFIRASDSDVTAMTEIISTHPQRDPNFIIEKLSK